LRRKKGLGRHKKGYDFRIKSLQSGPWGSINAKNLSRGNIVVFPKKKRGGSISNEIGQKKNDYEEALGQ